MLNQIINFLPYNGNLYTKSIFHRAMVRELDQQTIVCEFDFHGFPASCLTMYQTKLILANPS